MVNHPQRSRLFREIVAYLHAEYAAAYRAQWAKMMAEATFHPNTLAHAERHGYDPRECPTDLQHYSAEDHAEAVRIGNGHLEWAVKRAREAGASHANINAKDRISGSFPPSIREEMGFA